MSDFVKNLREISVNAGVPENIIKAIPDEEMAFEYLGYYEEDFDNIIPPANLNSFDENMTVATCSVEPEGEPLAYSIYWIVADRGKRNVAIIINDENAVVSFFKMLK